MGKWLLGLAVAAGFGGAAFGQVPQAGFGPSTYPSSGGGVTFAPVPSGGYMPNIYNRTTQPLSPYLNLYRGMPAVDYYYGVRPGTQNYQQNYGGSGFGGGYGGSRAGYLPLQAATAEQGVEIPEAGVALPNNQLYQTGHPVGFSTGPGRMGAGGYGASRAGFTRSQTAPPARRTRTR